MAVDPETQEKIEQRARAIFERHKGDPRSLALLAAQFQHFAEGSKADALYVSGGVSEATKKPFVHMGILGFDVQLGAQQAREHALLILEAAEAAVADAAAFKWATEALGVDSDRAATIVAHMRDFRADRWGGGDSEGSDDGGAGADGGDDPEPGD